MKFSIVDVFAESRYAGNQLAVIEEAAELTSSAMQLIAREMNFSETTFVTARSTKVATVRIFTPAEELPFAGHPTLGTAWVLTGGRGGLVLDLKAGRVPVRFDGDIGWLTPPPVTEGEASTPTRPPLCLDCGRRPESRIRSPRGALWSRISDHRRARPGRAEAGTRGPRSSATAGHPGISVCILRGRLFERRRLRGENAVLRRTRHARGSSHRIRQRGVRQLSAHPRYQRREDRRTGIRNKAAVAHLSGHRGTAGRRREGLARRLRTAAALKVPGPRPGRTFR